MGKGRKFSFGGLWSCAPDACFCRRLSGSCFLLLRNMLSGQNHREGAALTTGRCDVAPNSTLSDSQQAELEERITAADTLCSPSHHRRHWGGFNNPSFLFVCFYGEINVFYRTKKNKKKDILVKNNHVSNVRFEGTPFVLVLHFSHYLHCVTQSNHGMTSQRALQIPWWVFVLLSLTDM